ncbi:hypothetical protein [Prosthecobacter sp.]|uniref:hypothetical protein n=1 Tax=Prosthecobacter sp. TaxID=1965333 RepID=UPI002488BFBD|nr:hypothetical protein [Prosthecobacter sp.]MDI1313859.1 hypothetical protein [Prosthecobacter sp.]
MNRNFKYHRDKKLLAIDRERRVLWKLEWQTMEIDPPIPRGWIRHWRMTAKAKNRHDLSVLKTILDAIDNPRFHWRKSFVSGRRRVRKMIENTQALCCIREHRWKRLGWPEDWKKYFQKILVNPGRPDQTFSYKILREDLFELFIERHYVREVRLLDPEAKARIMELDQYLAAKGRHRLEKLLDCGYLAGPDIHQTNLARLAERRIQKALQGDWEAEVSRSSVFLPRQLSHFTRSSKLKLAKSKSTMSRTSPVRVPRPSVIARYLEVRSRFGTAAGAANPAVSTITVQSLDSEAAGF